MKKSDYSPLPISMCVIEYSLQEAPCSTRIQENIMNVESKSIPREWPTGAQLKSSS